MRGPDPRIHRDKSVLGDGLPVKRSNDGIKHTPIFPQRDAPE
jgi:hypothetical protein